MKLGSEFVFCTIPARPLPPLEWRSIGETKSVLCIARSSPDWTGSG